MSWAATAIPCSGMPSAIRKRMSVAKAFWRFAIISFVPTGPQIWNACVRWPNGGGSQPVSQRSGISTMWSEWRWVRNTAVTAPSGIWSCHNRNEAPRPQSINNFSGPASTKMLGPNRSTTGIGLPVPSRVTFNSWPPMLTDMSRSSRADATGECISVPFKLIPKHRSSFHPLKSLNTPWNRRDYLDLSSWSST